MAAWRLRCQGAGQDARVLASRMLPESRREMLQAWPYEWRGVGGLLGDGIECQWRITYSIGTRAWCTGIGTQRLLRKHKMYTKPRLSWDHHEEGKNLTNTDSVSSPPHILRPPNLWFQVGFYFLFFSQNTWIVFINFWRPKFHWMNPSYNIAIIFPGGTWELDLNLGICLKCADQEQREMLPIMSIGSIERRAREICMLCRTGIILEQHLCNQ